MLDDRKKRILQAIVEEYINTAEPVSSASLVKNYGMEYSSATIRNEMAELEKLGLLDKPHTSAGRVPSEKGYRYYVDELMQDNELTLEEIQYIQKQLETKVDEMEDLTKIATNTLSEITHYTTVAIGPTPTTQYIDEIKFVLLGSKMLMAVIMTDTGMVKETIIRFDEDIYENQVYTLNTFFNNKLKGEPLDSGFAKDMNVYIGDENDQKELKDFSVVTFKHKVGNKDLGTIGIIGPKRMDYSKVISVMKYISKKLNDNNE